MKFDVVLKTPDALDRAVRDALSNEKPDLSNYEIADEAFVIKEQCSKWFRCGEMVTLEIDTDAGTCVVVCNKK